MKKWKEYFINFLRRVKSKSSYEGKGKEGGRR